MPRWVEHQSDEEAGSSSDEDETAIARQQQVAQREQQQKRKADTPEPGPSTQKKLKLSISLNKSKLECHVRTPGLQSSFARFPCTQLMKLGFRCVANRVTTQALWDLYTKIAPTSLATYASSRGILQ